jgi:hypothetical protein
MGERPNLFLLFTLFLRHINNPPLATSVTQIESHLPSVLALSWFLQLHDVNSIWLVSLLTQAAGYWLTNPYEKTFRNQFRAFFCFYSLKNAIFAESLI